MREQIMIGLGIFILIILNYQIYEKEDLKANGEMILLKLAPVDPRSLMQGDYMRLRFELDSQILDRQIQKTQQKIQTSSPQGGEVIESSPSPQGGAGIESNSSPQGVAVIEVNSNHVGHFLRLEAKPQRDLLATQRQIKVKRVSRYYRVQPNAFFFQEGHAKLYEEAKYGVFRVAQNGQALLVGLADKDRKQIKPSKHKVDALHLN